MFAVCGQSEGIAQAMLELVRLMYTSDFRGGIMGLCEDAGVVKLLLSISSNEFEMALLGLVALMMLVTSYQTFTRS